MKSNVFALIMVIGILGVVPLCYAQPENTNASIEEVKKETQDLLQTIGSYSVGKKDEAVQKAKEALNNLDERIDALEAKVDKNWDKMTETARMHARENLKTIRKLRNQAAEWYGSMETSSTDAWDHLKNGFSKAYKALANAWEKSEKEFNPKE